MLPEGISAYIRKNIGYMLLLTHGTCFYSLRYLRFEPTFPWMCTIHTRHIGDSTIATTTTSIAAKRKHKRKKTLVVLMVGGISVLEMAALRCLSRDPTFPYRIVMATTEVLHGNSIMRSFFPEE